MRKASLSTLFFAVFLDLVGFGLVVPFPPEVARREMGRSRRVAPFLGTAYSLRQARQEIPRGFRLRPR